MRDKIVTIICKNIPDHEKVNRLEKLFRDSVQSGAEGQVNRLVGAPVGAAGVVEDTTTTERSDIEPDPESGGSPPLGPQARSGEALRHEDWFDLWNELSTAIELARKTDQYTKKLAPKALQWTSCAGFTISRIDDGERSEHRGPNVASDLSPAQRERSNQPKASQAGD